MTLAIDLQASFTAEGAEKFVVNADLTVDSGDTLVILGPSGSGKSLLLETIAGFHPHTGTVALAGTDVTDASPEDRDFGFVFQDYQLFPHLTVAENVAYGTRYHDRGRSPTTLLSELGVEDLADRYPPTLSGGEKQRIALARALAVRPQVILLDEPLASLDVPTRKRLRGDLVDVLADVTAIYVTHNRTTARAIADRIAVMDNGTIVQQGTPTEVFEHPRSAQVAAFTGANVIEVSDGLQDHLDNLAPSTDRVAVRPEAITVDPATGELAATVKRVVQEDAVRRLTVSLGQTTLDAYTHQPVNPGETVWLSIPDNRVHPL